MDKKGFTLMELLAVIVILAIIAFVAVPIFYNLIDNSQKDADKRSVELYSKSIENAIVDFRMKKNRYPKDFEELVESDLIKYDGFRVECDEVFINKDGSFYLKKCKVEGREVESGFGTKKMFSDGDIVYFDVQSGKSCDEGNYDITNSYTGYNGIDKTQNTQTSCLKFYAFGDSGEDTINLILDHNTVANVNYVDKAPSAYYPSNINGPTKALNLVKETTSSWNGTVEPKTYVLRQTNYANYDIDYTGYKARLITAQEVAHIIGADTEINFDETSSKDKIYFDSNSTVASETCNENDTSGCKYGWLYDRTGTNCKNYGCLNNSNITTYGYWTSTAQYGSTNANWCVGDGKNGILTVGGYYQGNAWYSGAVRPVIEVNKANISKS